MGLNSDREFEADKSLVEPLLPVVAAVEATAPLPPRSPLLKIWSRCRQLQESTCKSRARKIVLVLLIILVIIIIVVPIVVVAVIKRKRSVSTIFRSVHAYH